MSTQNPFQNGLQLAQLSDNPLLPLEQSEIPGLRWANFSADSARIVVSGFSSQVVIWNRDPEFGLIRTLAIELDVYL